MNFNEYMSLDESINDIGIMKAMFMAGTPGSGKSYVISKVSSGRISPRIVNTDKFVEFFGKGGGVDWGVYGNKVELLNKTQLILYINSMLPLWIDGTSSNPRSLIKRAGLLKSIGYDVGLVWVETDIETAIERATKRKRVVPEEYIRKVYEQIKPLKAYYKNEFKYFKEVKNNDGELTDNALATAFNSVTNFFTAPLENGLGNNLIDNMKNTKVKYIDDYDKSIMNDVKKSIDLWYNEN